MNPPTAPAADKVLSIMRGLPGSGKSTWALRYAGDPSRVFAPDDWPGYGPSPDDYKRNWSPERSRLAHTWTADRLEAAMRAGLSPLVFDSMTLSADRALPAVRLAVRYGYRVEFRESQSEWWQRLRPLLADRDRNRDAIDAQVELLIARTAHGLDAARMKELVSLWEELDADELVRCVRAEMRPAGADSGTNG